jgi:glycosyltransferase involved in cell wall biosynthesis
MLSMSKYYEHKDYIRTWESKEVEKAWVDAWLVPYNDPDIIEPSKCFELERPSMSDFREAMGIYLAYFFIFSVKIPDRCPRVFQSTHHGISSLFGMILRYRRGVTFGIWDHAILWRECCLNISPAQCELPISMQSMLLSGIGLATRLAYFHADVIMPCTSLFNPMWEAEIGTDRGKLGSKKVFDRRIDPIVNGISNMESFTPVDKVRTDTPTVVMLSNVQFIKGIKTAILAADIIVNRYGFEDYKLVIYGAKDRQPSYALEMAKLIVENNLEETVILAGFGKPKEVLKDAWLFMNSSISEGLPLAIGEAALAGVPIVATEVGATALVMTDPEDQDKRYGEVVPPNDPVALARAQLSILGMVGPWAKFTEEVEDDPTAASRAMLPDEITSEDVEWLTNRMYEKSDDRRRLGLLSREVVLHSFHGNRYLREHEQMYWIQWHMAQMRADKNLTAAAEETFRFGTLPALRYIDEDDNDDDVNNDDEADASVEREQEKMALMRKKSKASMPTTRWQEFSRSNRKPKTQPPTRLSKLPRRPSVPPV